MQSCIFFVMRLIHQLLVRSMQHQTIGVGKRWLIGLIVLYWDSSRRKALRNASWDFGTGTINSTGTIRSAVKSSDDQAVVKGSPEDTTAARPTSSLDLPSMFADTDRDWQIVTGRNTSINGNHGEEPVGTQEEHEALASPENVHPVFLTTC